MARRTPLTTRRVAASASTSTNFLRDADLDELLTAAGVPKHKRVACADHLNQLFDFYRRRLARNKETEARHAETLRLLAVSARETYKRLSELPPALRLAVEPDYVEYVRKGFARYIAGKTAYAAAAKELARDNPD